MVQNYYPLLVAGEKADFSLYTCEILKAEGFYGFDTCIPLEAAISKGELQKHDIIILGASGQKEEMLNNILDYVREGGNLIAFRPDKRLMAALGMIDISATLSEAYIRIDSSSDIGKGLLNEALQFHGTADLYSPGAGSVIAGLQENKDAACIQPAVVLCCYGKGKAIIFTYNLPLSILLTRQGNPDKAGLECDGINGLRAMDMFTDGWVDVSRNHLNQADEQMRLLTHCIEYLSQTGKPLPRLWYFPQKLNSIAILTNDGEDSTEADFEPQFDAIESRGAFMSLYLKEHGLVSREKVQEWVRRGHEISGHPDDTLEAADPDWHNKCRVYGDMVEAMVNNFSLPMFTNVNHWFVWCGKDASREKDFTAEAKLEEKYGIKMDLNYAHYHNGSNQGPFLGCPGNYTGSGLPMRFADMKGDIVDVYQVNTNVYDQQYTENNDKDGFFECFRTVMDRSLEDEGYSVIGLKSHNDEWHFTEEPVLRMLEYAKAKGIPVWTAQRLLLFLQARDSTVFENIEWTGETLSFTIRKSTNSEGVTAMIPTGHFDKRASALFVNGTKAQLDVRNVKGRDYLFLDIPEAPQCSFTVRYETGGSL